ncbi:hypothetical protein Patl1_27607 [Pistacia atlantica]|uniref:Uncharacterized protein n=1 Tax=Pistacia atlantica TaxID=434234 RepID=A0ACC1BD01_9ROSI|nr:hypothetical protein Patl1_27607 [Pistacia atlantica]
MFWRERERENNNKEQNGGPPCGQVRVLVVGDSGVGKTSLVHLIVKGSSVARPSQTIGCTVGVKHITYGNSGSSSNSIKGDSERDFFIELWDVSGHERYKDCRSLFYSQINGERTKTSLQKWAAEIAATGSFSAPLGSGGPGGLPVPYIVIGNKADVAAKEGTGGSSGNLVDLARHWVEKQGLLPSSEELPLTESFPGSGSLIAELSGSFVKNLLVDGICLLIGHVLLTAGSLEREEGETAAKGARYDKEAFLKFFRMLIRRRYFSDDLPASNLWSVSPVHRSVQRLDENFSDEEKSYNRKSFSSDPYKYNMLPPLPAQRNLMPPPTLYPQQPVSVPENYSLPRFSLSGSPEISSTGRSKRTDINV